MFPNSIGQYYNPFLASLEATPSFTNYWSYPAIVIPSVYTLPGHTLNLVGSDGVNYGQVIDLSIVGTDLNGNTLVSGLFQSGSTWINILGTITPYQTTGPVSYTATFAFEGYDQNNSGLAVDFHGTISQDYQHASVSGSLAVYYPQSIFHQPGDKIHMTVGGVTYWEPANTPYTAVSGMWF
jgi:hypothetical protein